MPQHTSRRSKMSIGHQGFTVTEVVIVIAIAALIMLILFITIPAAQRNGRNYERKHAVDEVSGAISEYKLNVGHYPSNNAEGNAFINTYLKNISPRYTVIYRDNSVDHDVLVPLDSIGVQFGHWCNRYGNGENATDAIAGDDVRTDMYAIWTQVEPTSSGLRNFYCVDDYGK